MGNLNVGKKNALSNELLRFFACIFLIFNQNGNFCF